MLYFTRIAEASVSQLVKTNPAVVLVGPRQVGKTSLVKQLAAQFPREVVYYDLENPDDFNQFSNPNLLLEPLKDQTVILDEVQRVPALFPALRGLIDRHRQPGRFILLGSASPELIRDTSESLAGRVAYFELHPFTLPELPGAIDYRQHWLRGGFPASLLADSDAKSLDWREHFIRSYLERDLPLLGLRADPILIRRLWTMIAHLNGQLLNLSALGNSLDISAPTVRRYLNFLESAFLIRQLQPWHANTSKRLVKTPKIYLRDTGLLHALLRTGTMRDLQSHPALGASWEAYIVQEIAARLPARADLYFYRTHDGTEADLVVTRSGIPEVLVEIKYSTTPKPGKGFFIAKNDLATARNFIVCPVPKGYPLAEDVSVLSYTELDRIFL
ncbi:MAG: ATP-binding protein [Saprospirales bacterium]|nr:ATP-binding protein [Saprospirales bacterium]